MTLLNLPPAPATPAPGLWTRVRSVCCSLVCASLCALAFPPTTLHGETLHLRDGGRLTGKLEKRPAEEDDEQKVNYILRLRDGGLVAVRASEVARCEDDSAVDLEYDQLLAAAEDTAEGHEKLARWCQEHELSQLKEFHYREVLRWDPNHAEARRVLGYRMVQGEWLKPEEAMQRQGLVRYRGQWRLPQEVAALEQQQQADKQQKAWNRNLTMWRDWIGGRRDAEAVEKIRAIKDPLAGPALAEAINRESRPEIRELLVDTLADLPTSYALETLVALALNDDDGEFRLRCVRHLRERGASGAVGAFARALSSPSNATINRAAVALGQMGDRRAVLPLIQSLVTEHSTIVQPTSDIRPSFGSGPNGGFGGLSVGSKPTKITKRLENKSVLEALVALTDQNFLYDESSWRSWYIAQHALPEDVNLRRDP